MNMLMRSTSSPVLGKLIVSFPHHLDGLRASLCKEIPKDNNESETESPSFQRRPHRSVSLSSSIVSSPRAPQLSRVVDDSRADDGDWNYGVDISSWPRYRRVQSDGELTEIAPTKFLAAECRSSSPNHRCIDALDDHLVEGDLDRSVAQSNAQRQWSRRLAISRTSSLRGIESANTETSRSVDLNVESSGDDACEDQASTESSFESPIVRHNFQGGRRSNTPENLAPSGNGAISDSKREALNPHTALVIGMNGSSLVGNSQEVGELEFSHTQKVAAVHGSTRDKMEFLKAQNSGEMYSTTTSSSKETMKLYSARQPVSETNLVGPMYIAGGLGIDSGGAGGMHGGGSGGGAGNGGAGGKGDSFGAEAHYRRALDAEPGHPLLLRNYAKFLYEVRRDVAKAEEYYQRAILANPGDGEVLGQYAKLIWDIYKDQDRAESYYNQALQAAPDDCYLMASYASFLWAADDEDFNEGTEEPVQVSQTSTDARRVPDMYGSATATSTP